MEVTNDTGKEVQDMNSVVLTVPGVGVKSKNIGHSKLDEGTGIALAESALKKAEEWTPLKDIFAGVFDTTSSNTGICDGAMVHLEKNLQSKLLWIACRHHVSELHIKHVYNKTMMPTKGPDDPLFKSFQEWFISHRQVEGFPDPNMFRQYD